MRTVGLIIKNQPKKDEKKNQPKKDEKKNQPKKDDANDKVQE